MKKRTVIHFGGGALGRGMVIPILIESNCDVILVDTNSTLLETIKNAGDCYTLDVTDDVNRFQNIKLKKVINSISEYDRLIEELRKYSVVTTSVRRENLKYVIPTLCEAWKNIEQEHFVICCENVEGIGEYCKDLFVENGMPEEALKKIKTPDTIVDRICSMDEKMNITSEKFYECSVDKSEINDLGIKCITEAECIEAKFYRKRYLMNTYADLVSFLGKKKGLKYLYEAVQDKDINERIIPYMELLKKSLNISYKIPMVELENWQITYRKRLSNEKIPRELDTVARNLEVKLSLSERFIAPLIDLLNHDEDISLAIPIIKELLGCLETDEPIEKILESIWGNSSEGNQLLSLLVE